MGPLERVRLRIVPVADIRAHEIADPARERRILDRLSADQVLRDPLMVGELNNVPGYVLLDGTNRHRALAELGLPHALVQVIDYGDENAVQLRTWCHLAGRCLNEIVEAAVMPDTNLVPLSPLEAGDAMRTPGTLAVLLTRSEQYALRRNTAGRSSRAEQLRALVDLYEPTMTRVDCDPDNVEDRAMSVDTDDALVAFPPFSRADVVAMAMRGVCIPAGITRHVIQCGRALRVNVPLTLLSSNLDLPTANAALDEHLAGMHPRYYREPTILFDS